MSIGSFTLVKDEANWIGPHIEAVLPYIDQMVFFDGNSKDGTWEILKDFAFKSSKITLVGDMDPINLKEDYTRMFNECMRTLKTDLAIFLHPDMYVKNPELFPDIGKSDATSLFTNITSYAGDPGGPLLQWSGKMRSNRWKNIYRLRNPDLGAHYHGFYGAQNEDVYFSAITGKSHRHFADDFNAYPYEVRDSGLEIMHFSDVRPYERRLERMKTCLRHQGYPESDLDEIAKSHPRVSLKSGPDFNLIPASYPTAYKESLTCSPK